MLSLVIADDETGIIDLCKMLIEYPNTTVVGEAHNGVELFEKIGELHPNTVITDISMPGMTGLELIERARTSYPEVNFIVMSGYTDFEYVQSALRLGVWDYLLKPLNKKELNRILKKLDEHLESVQVQTRQQERMEDHLQASLSMLRERYAREVWQKRIPLPVPRIEDTLILPGGRLFQCLLFCVDNLLSTKAALDAPMLQAGGAMDAISAIEAEHGMETVMFSVGDGIAQMLIYPPEAGEDDCEALLKAVSGEIRKFNSQGAFSRLTGAASQLRRGSWEQLPEVMSQAQTALKWRLEKNQTALIRFQATTAAAVEGLPPFSRAAALQEAVTENRMNEICHLIEEAWSRVDGAPPGSRYRVLEELLEALNRGFSQLPGAEHAEQIPEISVSDVLYGDLTPAVISQHIQDYVREALEMYHTYVRQRENSVISRAKQYVQAHLAEDISLNDVARQVYLSPAYFSTLFKAETGCGFVKYLQRVRVEQAKKLLKNPGMRIKDIAEAVGYRDMKFFNKVFLNETSVTPSEYRRFYS